MLRDTRPRVPVDELHSTLEQVLSQHFRSPRSIHKLRRRLSAYSSSWRIENLELELDGGQRLRLVFKDLGRDSLLPTARQIRPGFLYDPRREIDTYRRLLDPTRLGTPVCYGAVTSARRDRHWLFLERVPGPLLWQVGRLESWEKAARWLAVLHSESNPDRLMSRCNPPPPLLRYDADFYAIWLQRAEENLRRLRVPVPPARLRRFLRLANRYDRVIQKLVGLPMAFTHGEFYPSNVIVRNTRNTRQICPIDWELASLAPGLIDLAALVSGDWSPEHQRRLVAAYHEAWEPVRGGRFSLADLLDAVAWCQLHRAVQFLGWAEDWSPPVLHARDWLREACRLADRLGL